jgi:D-glycero-D-manno-heptose 1,7-bisphosphate phosphatase
VSDTSAARRPAVFLDRDGTLVREVDYLRAPAELELLAVGAGLRALAEAGFALVLVTNQSGVARGYLDEETLAAIHSRLAELLAREGVALEGVEYCPHHPEHGAPPYRADCDCRKPRPGMLLRAAERLGLDLARSWTIGDSERDLLAGEAAGLRGGVLVRTGKGEEELRRLRRAGAAPPRFAFGLEDAAAQILSAG